ncbi:hypothetical protein B484DRAFT_448534 [Ochromonadaceae sp. CCMP2298]|nr:hypothetical protein B484DRAFT_448534 [Ochromonadaceae sp. CCMP2298]|mmetsp:Transcript_12771/g.28374  ORF Transcript_12771/g.28374 Transcript_12771/m.28374 type:complete len:190 (-) Transcript_12771:15-584(-)
MTEKKQSQFSATMIGLNGPSDRLSKAREVFQTEAGEISSYLQGIHHSRKIAHQQVNYADTVARLGKFQEQIPLYVQKVPEVHNSAAFGNGSGEYRISEYSQKMGEYIIKEKDMNDRKRLWNRETGRKAVLNDVLAGTGPIPKTYLFPQKASHTQVLALTGKLKAPDASILPPRVARGKKWLGEGVGWEG